MNDLAACPTDRQLEELAAGVEPDPSVKSHLDDCSACRARADRLRDDNAFLSEFARHASATGGRSSDIGADIGAEAGPESGANGHSVTPNVPGYRVGRIIGRGGQAVVYEAEQETTDRRVAVKMLLDVAERSPQRAERFEREIRIAAGLKHPAIVTVYDSGVAPSGHPFCAMEFVAGCPVTQWCDEARPAMTVRAILELFARIADAVSYSHQHGVMHRDLKPSNVLIDNDGNPRVLDFGLAKALEQPGERTLTASGEFLGTLAYAAPEQVRHDGALADIRTDVYALGVMLYELLTGRLPYDVSGSVASVVASITERDAAPPSTHASGIDDEIDTIVLKALAKSPERRYASASALLDDVERYLEGRAIAAKRDSAWYVLRTAARRHRVLVGASVAIVFAIAVFGLTMATLYGLKEQRADELAASLRTSNIDRGRLMVRGGNIPAAEEILWREYLAGPEGVMEPTPALPADPAHWALWELYAKHPCLAVARLHEDAVRSIAFGEPPLIVTAADDGTVSHWDPAELAAVWRIRVGAPGTGMVISGNGRRVARWNESHIQLFDLEVDPGPDGGRWVGEINARYMDRAKIALSHSGDLVVGAADIYTSVWEATGNHVREIQIGPRARPRRVHAVAAGAEATRAATVSQKLIKFYDKSSNTELAAVPLDARPERVTMSADGNWAAVITDNVVRVHSVTDGREVSRQSDVDKVAAAAFSSDGTVAATGGWSRRLRIWEPTNPARPVHVVLGHTETITAIAVGPDARVIASGDAGGTVRLWEGAPGACVTRIATPELSPHTVRVAPGGELMATAGGRNGNNGAVELRDARTGVLQSRWSRDEMVVDLAFVPAGDRIVTCGLDGVVRVWEIESGAQREVHRAETALRSVAVSPDGRTVAVGSDETGDVRIIDLGGGGDAAALTHHRLRVPAVAFSPDGRHLVTASTDGTAAIWDVASRALRHVLAGHAGSVRTARFHPDGKRVVTGGDDGSVRIWDVASGASVALLDGHEDDVFAVSFSPDGAMLASGDRSGVIRLWDVVTGRNLAVLDQLADAGPVMAIDFAPDGVSLVSAATQSVVGWWDLAYYDRFIAGNMGYWAKRVGEETAD